MSQIGKYLLVVLLIANLSSQYVLFTPMSNILFYGSLGVCVLYSIISCHQFLHINNLKATSFLWLFIITLTVYQFTLGIISLTEESIKYLCAKCVVLLIIYWGITTNFRFYYQKIIPIVIYTITLLIIYGYLFHNEIFAGRSTCGFGNPNSTSAISSIGFAGFLLIGYKPRWLTLICAAVCLFGVLAGGSRTVTAVCIIAIFLKYKFSFKTVALFSICLTLSLIIFPYLGFNLNGINRVVNAFTTHDFVGSRGEVREATIKMITERPWSGWGFKSGIQGEAEKITTLGSHNGYLDIIKAMGYPFATIIFVGSGIILWKIKNVLTSKDPFIRFHLFIAGSILLSAFYESYIIGVNQIMTNFLFMSISILQYYSYYKIDYEQRG